MSVPDAQRADLGQRLQCSNCGAKFIVTQAGNRPECCGMPLTPDSGSLSAGPATRGPAQEGKKQ